VVLVRVTEEVSLTDSLIVGVADRVGVFEALSLIDLLVEILEVSETLLVVDTLGVSETVAEVETVGVSDTLRVFDIVGVVDIVTEILLLGETLPQV